jgi:hypothetical protein
MTAYKNYPLAECARGVDQILRNCPGSVFFQKWTCVRCGERVTGNTPNMLSEFGHHEERADGSACGGVTNIRKSGCNYAVHMAIGGVADMTPKGSA